MKKFLLALALIAWSHLAFGVVIIQSDAGGGGSLTLTERDDWSGNSPATSASFTPSDSSLLVVIAGGFLGSAASATISDSETSTWTLQESYDTATAFESFCKIWTTPITTGTSMTVTVTTASGALQAVAVDITGYDTGDPVGLSANDGTNSASRSGSYALSLGGTSASNSIVIGGIESQSSVAGDITPGTGWTEIAELEDGGGGASSFQYIEGAESNFDYDDFDVDNSPFAGWCAAAVEIQAD